MKTGAWIFALMLFFCYEVKGYEHKKAILMVERASQVDSVGYNFVSDLATDVYGWISSGKVVLWDSPEKKAVLSFNDLQNVEVNSQSFFKSIRNVFIYENWSSDDKTTSFTVEGISFVGLNFKGKDVIFGFVEFNTPLRELFETTPLHINANGNSGTTLYSTLMNKGYQFTLIYFDNAPIVKYKASAKIVAAAFNPKKQFTNRIMSKQTKLVEYGWDTVVMAQVNVSHGVAKVLSDFFNSNPQEFFNFGGDKIYSFLKDAPISVSDFHVIETWTKDKDGKIYFTPQFIDLYIKGAQLQPIPFDKLDDWKIQYKEESLNAFLSAKDFPYLIKKINETIIPYTLAQSYKDALFANSWYQILEKQ